MNYKPFLQESEYIDYSSDSVQECMKELYRGVTDAVEKARIAYYFVRDRIPHSFDCQAQVVTAKASDVLRWRTGICHAKANLLAALLRPQGIPVGLCFQHLTRMDDDAKGYCVHCYSGIYLQDRWIKVDARGNKSGVDARFCLKEPMLAYPNRPKYDEFFWHGIYAIPHPATMKMLENSRSVQDILENIPDTIDDLQPVQEGECYLDEGSDTHEKM